MYKILIVFLSSLLLLACTVDKSKSRKKTSLSKTVESVSIDTGKVTTEIKSEVSTKYGDTLKAALYFSDASILSDTTAETDSIESAGIKVTGTLTKVPGGFKMKLLAVAKPVLKTDIATAKRTEQKGLAVSTSVKTDSTTTDLNSHKNIRAGPAWYWWILLILFLLALIIKVFWKYIKPFIAPYLSFL